MKNWIWKIFASTDDLADPIGGRLARCKPKVEAPPELYENIMVALRSRPAPAKRPHAKPAPERVLLLRVTAAVCLLALLATAVVWMRGPQPVAGNQIATPSSFTLAPQIASSLEVLTGLETEMKRLDSDLRHTAEHLLASIP